jgi:copper chaperone CopZ
VRSALLSVKGVKRAKVTLEDHLAVVTFDPREATVQTLMAAANDAEPPLPSIHYNATVKPTGR